MPRQDQSLTRAALRAPGLYFDPPRPRRSLPGVRMDVCAFVGLAPRGPVRVLQSEQTGTRQPLVEGAPRRRSVAVAVESFDEYRRLFGAFEGPGLLPYAVASFFQQGGQRAYIVRIVHEYGPDRDAWNAGGVAQGLLTGEAICLEVAASSTTTFDVKTADSLPVGTLVRATLDGGLRVTRFVAQTHPLPSGLTRLELDQPLPGTATLFEALRGELLDARNEGSWGNNLRAALGFSVTPLRYERVCSSQGRIDADQFCPVGSLLRFTLPGGVYDLRFVTRTTPEEERYGATFLADLDERLVESPLAVEVVEGVLAIEDRPDRRERHERLGLCKLHPRWMSAVLSNESNLVAPHPSWADREIRPPSASESPREPVLPDVAEPQFTGGHDRYSDITPEDFFDDAWVSGNPDPGSGVLALVHLDDLSTVVVPDLYSPEPLPERSNVADLPRGGPTFVRCPRPGQSSPSSAAQPQLELAGLQLDPQIPEELRRIVQWQQRLVALADELQSFVVLLDAPPRLAHRQLLRWRSQFRSSYAAAYCPWLIVAHPDDGRLVRINPSASAAGILARQEIQFGVPHGPANVLAAEVVDVDEVISSARHDELHPLGVNVFQRERDGVRLTAARTLSVDRGYRQLSVRRLMLMLRRVLEQQMHWMVFEPNGPALWSEVRHLLQNYLRQLYRAGAFRGETEEQAFFVRCDAVLNPPRVLDAGQLMVEVGVAPAEPIEFLVIRISAGADGAKLIEV